MPVFQKAIHGFFHGSGLIRCNVGYIQKYRTADGYHGNPLIQDFIHEFQIVVLLRKHDNSVQKGGIQRSRLMHIDTFDNDIIFAPHHAVDPGQHIVQNEGGTHLADGGEVKTNHIGP